jgi:hypothetical protein
MVLVETTDGGRPPIAATISISEPVTWLAFGFRGLSNLKSPFRAPCT